MNWYKRLAFREFLLKEAESDEHKRLKVQLGEWAVSRGYAAEQSVFESGAEPDVLRQHADRPFLFVGDAKWVVSEPASRAATRKRLEQYFRDFVEMLAAGKIEGGTIAIATNTLAGAEAWVEQLNSLASECRLTGPDGQPPEFQVEAVDAQTFVTFW